MLDIRVIPCLLLKGSGLVKTKKFKNPVYLGDPINAVSIFNEKEVNELIFLDISATSESREPNYALIKQITNEAFIPFAYGGGISNLKQIETLFKLGVEKIVLNTAAFFNPAIVTEACKVFGSQSIVISVDVNQDVFGRYDVWVRGGKINTRQHPAEYSKRMQDLGAGEIFLNSINRDGTYKGYDIELIKTVSNSLEIPLIASGGASSLNDFKSAIIYGKASAVAAGSLFVFYGPLKAVLISYPSPTILENLFKEK